MKAVRGALALIGGIIIAGGAVAVVESIGHSLVAADKPFGFAVLGLCVAALLGTFVVRKFGGHGLSLILPAILAVLMLINVFSFSHPVWFVPLSLAGLGLGWWLGAMLALRASNLPKAAE